MNSIYEEIYVDEIPPINCVNLLKRQKILTYYRCRSLRHWNMV